MSGTYVTKTKLNSTEKTLKASLELKLNTKDLISEINASADVIILEAGRLIINSGNFQLSGSGDVSIVDGSLKIVSSSNAKIIDFSKSGIRFYNQKGNEVGGLVSTIDDNGHIFFTLHKGSYLHISKTSNDGTQFYDMFSFSDINKVPYIRNTANGTLFEDKKNKRGITVENGLITAWSMPATERNTFQGRRRRYNS